MLGFAPLASLPLADDEEAVIAPELDIPGLLNITISSTSDFNILVGGGPAPEDA